MINGLFAIHRYDSAGAGMPRIRGVVPIRLDNNDFGHITRGTRGRRIANGAGDDYTHVEWQRVRRLRPVARPAIGTMPSSGSTPDRCAVVLLAMTVSPV